MQFRIAGLCLAAVGLGFGSTVRATDTWHLTQVQMVTPSSGWALAQTSRGSVLLKTGSGGRSWRSISPKGIWPLSPEQLSADRAVGGEDINIGFLDSRTGWMARKGFENRIAAESKSQGGRHWVQKLGEKPILVERTQDGGRHWAASQVPDPTGYSLLLSFLDARHGSLLTISDMASGSTRKALYRTGNGGRTWTAVTKALPDHIDPTGITFRTNIEGWLTAGYHGSDEMPFYRTTDAGRHWHLQDLDISPLCSNGYGTTYPPVFFGPRHRQGVLPINWKSHTPESAGIALYQTKNAGRTWRLQRRIPRIQGFSDGADLHFINFSTGWAFDRANPIPTLSFTQDGGKQWQIVYPPRRKSH